MHIGSLILAVLRDSGIVVTNFFGKTIIVPPDTFFLNALSFFLILIKVHFLKFFDEF